MRVHRCIPDAIGLLVLAALAGLVAWLVAVIYGSEDALWAFGIGYPVLMVSSLLAWYGKQWPTDPQDIFLFGVWSVVLGAGSFGLDVLYVTAAYPKSSLNEAIWHAGSPFGILLTIAICPGFTSVALAGAARALFLSSSATHSRS